jgi:hypothetical protein
MKLLPEEINATLNDCISSLGQVAWLYATKPTYFSRERKIGFCDVVKFVLSMQKESIDKELLKFFDYQEDIPSRSALFQQRKKITPEAFRQLLLLFNNAFPHENLLKGYRILACDGSRFNIARNPDDPATYILANPKSGGCNQVHLNALYDLLNHYYVDAHMQNISELNEQRALCQMLDQFSDDSNDKAIFIGDRCYSSFNIFAHAIENNQFFLTRAKDPSGKSSFLSTVDLPDAETFDIDYNAQLTRRHTNEIKAHPEKYKRIANQTFDYLERGSKDFYPISFRIIKFPIGKNNYEYIITNLPRQDFNLSEIKDLYNLRWGIETSFRDLKYTIGLAYFHSKKVDLIFQELFAKLTLYNFCQVMIEQAIVTQKESTKYRYKINIAIAIHLCVEFLHKMQHGRLMNVLELISRYLLPVRPNRSAPRRLHDQHAKSFIYR